MSQEQFDRGLKVRKEVLGAEYVEQALSRSNSFNKDFQDIVTEYCWGGSWGRGGLPNQTRSLLNLAMLSALGRSHEFKLHLRGAIRNGCSLEDIRETLIQVAVYCGIPAGVEAFRLANEVFEAEGIEIPAAD